MKKREYTRSQSSASDWTNSRQKERAVDGLPQYRVDNVTEDRDE